MKQTITVVIIAKNEETRIVPCLESVKWCDEIVVVDDMSVDETSHIARKYGAKVVAHPSNGDHDTQRNIGIDNASSDWILQMDADERVTPDLRRDIETILKASSEYAAYSVGRRNYFLNKFMIHGGWYENQVRFFKKGNARYVGHSVHETLKVDGKTLRLKSYLDHYAFGSISQYISRQLYYADIEARVMYEDRGREITFKEINYHLKAKPVKLFFKIYIKKMGFRDGIHGFILSLLNAWRHFVIWAVYYGKYYNRDKDACKVCGSEEFTKFLDFKGKGKGIIICKNCGAFRTTPFSAIDYNDHEFYCEHYLKNEKLFRRFAEMLIRLIKKHKEKGSLLDIGCSVGFLLEEARNQGFDAEGMELNKKAVDIVASKGFNVKRCMLNEAGYDSEKFDAVILNHILEHINEPNDFLYSIFKIMKKDGILVIGVPNHDSLVARLLKRNWYGWGMPEHLWHFDRKSLKYLLAKNGFIIKEIIQNSQHYPVSKSLRKNAIAMLAHIGNMVGLGDQLIILAEKK